MRGGQVILRPFEGAQGLSASIRSRLHFGRPHFSADPVTRAIRSVIEVGKVC